MVHDNTNTIVSSITSNRVVVLPTTTEWTQGVSTSRCVCTDSLIDSYSHIYTEKIVSTLFHFVDRTVVVRHHREYIQTNKQNETTNHV